MSVHYECDTCGKKLEPEQAYRKKVVFVNIQSTNMAASYMPDDKHWCKPCVEVEALPFRRQRGRKKKVTV